MTVWTCGYHLFEGYFVVKWIWSLLHVFMVFDAIGSKFDLRCGRYSSTCICNVSYVLPARKGYETRLSRLATISNSIDFIDFRIFCSVKALVWRSAKLRTTEYMSMHAVHAELSIAETVAVAFVSSSPCLRGEGIFVNNVSLPPLLPFFAAYTYYALEETS